MKNTLINRKAIIKIAKALGDLNNEVVFVGGAIVSLYIDDPAAEDIRPTKDIDLTFQITSVSKLEQLRASLTEKGFVQTHKDDIICRFRYEELLVDVMSTVRVGWAPSNRWFMPGFQRAVEYNLDEVIIKILPLPYFLASKMVAFFDRGIKDLYGSHDFEDIIYIFNYTGTLEQQVLSADKEAKMYLIECIKNILNSESILAVIPGHLYYETADERFEMIKNKLDTIIDITH